MNSFVLCYKNHTTDKITLLTKDKKEVDYLDKDAIMSYYDATKLHSQLSKTSHLELKMVNLLELIVNNFAETILLKLEEHV